MLPEERLKSFKVKAGAGPLIVRLPVPSVSTVSSVPNTEGTACNRILTDLGPHFHKL